MELSLHYAERLVNRVLELLAPVCQRAEVAGEIRRHKEPVNRLEVVVIPLMQEVRVDLFKTEFLPAKEFVAVVDQWVLLKGDALTENELERWLPGFFTLRIHIADPDNYGLKLALATGNFAFKETLKAKWARKRWTSAGGYLRRKKDRLLIPVPEEHDLFALLGLPYVEPINRNQDLTDEQRDKLAGKPGRFSAGRHPATKQKRSTR